MMDIKVVGMEGYYSELCPDDVSCELCCTFRF